MKRVNHVRAGEVSTDAAVTWDDILSGGYSVVLEADFLPSLEPEWTACSTKARAAFRHNRALV